jgi:hypothetical protein
LIILGLAVLVLPWEAPHRPGQVGPAPGVAAPDRPSAGVLPSAPQPAAAFDTERQRTGADVSAPIRATAIEPVAHSRSRAAQLAAQARKPALSRTVGGAAPGVRELTPGSRAHSEVIASNIASEEFQDVASPLARLYLAYFNRPPDYEGFDYYIGERDRGEPLDAVADEFAGSAEFNTRYGSLDNAAFVDRVLQNIFGFPGDAEQHAYWVDQIESGRMTRGQVMLIFSESPGYRAMTANEVFVAMAYAETLGRAPDPADFSRWVGFLDAGNPRRAVIDGLLADRGKR